MATTYSSLLQKGITNNVVCNKTNDYQIVLGAIDGVEIPNTNIASFMIEEDLFSLLPAASFTMSDAGRFFDSGDMYVGQTVYVQFTPMRMYAEDDKVPSYVSMRMKIVSIDSTRNNMTGTTAYIVTCLYDALATFASVYTYPPKSIIQFSTNTETSVNAIKAQLNAGGLDAISNVSTTDSMIWLNTNNKVYQCVNKFLSHSWISDNDALLTYTSFVNDKSFDENSSKEEIEEAFTKAATITSCKTLAQQTSEATYIPAKRTGEHPNCYRYASAFVRNHAGVSTIKNEAYTQTEYMFNPLGVLNADTLTDFSSADLALSNLLTGRFVTGALKTTYSNPEISLASKSSKIQSLYEVTNNSIDVGYHMPNTHAHYDVAPAHNRAILASFFNMTIDLTFDVNQQNDEVLLTNTLPHIGQKVVLDCGNSDEELSENYTGNYIIAQLKYVISDNQTAKCVVTLVSDGTNKKPNLTV